MKIVVADDFPVAFTGSPAEPLLRAMGELRIFTARGADDETELARRIGDAEVVVNIRAHARFSRAVLAACPKLLLISIWGTGTDNVDLAECRARGIAVANTPGVNAPAVAEHTMALMMAVMRKIPAFDRELREGRWPRGNLDQLHGKTLGIIGLGAIGRRVADIAGVMGMTRLVWTWGPDAGRAAQADANHVPLETLLRESDVVSLHVRLSPETDGLLSRDRLALMKPTSYLVNTARAALVDREALIDALRTGRLAGAGLDVFHQEPIAPDDPLLALPNVVLTPHNAGMTREVTEAGLTRAVENVALFLAGAPRDLVVAPP